MIMLNAAIHIKKRHELIHLMSTNYFILTKPLHQSVSNNDENQIITLKHKRVYILPHVNVEYYFKHGLFENTLIDWCSQFCKPDKLFLDIGAHTGTYAISLAPYCKTAYAFEPQKMTYYALCGSIALSNATNVIALNYGLGSEEQTTHKQTLNIVSHDGGGSTIHPDNQRVLRTEEIVVNTLDSLELDNIGFMKMDVENNELQVLQGARETLKRCQFPPFIFELNDASKHELTDYIRDELKYKIIPIIGTSNMFLAAQN